MDTISAFLGAIRDREVSAVQADGPFAVGAKVIFVIAGGNMAGADFVTGTVEKITTSGRSTFLAIRSDSGIAFVRRSCDVQPLTDWRERVDRAVASAVGNGDGPLPIRMHPDTPAGPGVSVYWMFGAVLFVGIYTTETTGTGYRWDNGLDQPPTVVDWDLDGPGCA
jgi:hypothetical protein